MKQHQSFSTLGLGLCSLGVILGIAGFGRLINPSNNPAATAQVANAQITNKTARQQQPKLIVARIHAQWCSSCRALTPVMASLQQQYGNNVQFVTFDVTDRSTLQASEARARQLKISNFLQTNKSRPSLVGLINPSNQQTMRQFTYNSNRQDYVNAINGAIAQLQRR
jgi:thiol-disulfide isomerase/thioredoxin